MPPGYSPVVTEILNLNQVEEIQGIEAAKGVTIILDEKVINNQHIVTYNKYLLVSSLDDKFANFTTLLGTNNVGIDI